MKRSNPPPKEPFPEDYWEAIFYLDEKGGIINVGEDYLRRAGYPKKAVVKHQFLDFVDEESRVKYGDIVERTLREREIDDIPMRLITKDGSKILCNFAMTLIRDLAGATLGIAAIGEEIGAMPGMTMDIAEKIHAAVMKLEETVGRMDSLLDEIKSLQKQVSNERVSVLSTLVVTITHEINNSLNGIVANANLVSDFVRELPTSGDAISKERTHLLERSQHILDCAERIGSVVEKLNKLQQVVIREGTRGIPMIDLEGSSEEPKG